MACFRAMWLPAMTLAGVLSASTAQAMLIRAFVKMADQDRVDYLDGLITGAQKVLTDVGEPAMAAQVKYLFTTKDPGDADSIGMVDFERNLAIFRLRDARHAEGTPSEVEDVIFMTLENDHIPLPYSFDDVNKDFRPKLPPKR